MKVTKILTVVVFAGALVGCGGHGYEGEFEASNDFIGSLGSEKIVIGSDFIESSGQRHIYDEIFVREAGENEYLVFKDGNSELSWRIVDQDTLVQSIGGMNIELNRVD